MRFTLNKPVSREAVFDTYAASSESSENVVWLITHSSSPSQKQNLFIDSGSLHVLGAPSLAFLLPTPVRTRKHPGFSNKPLPFHLVHWQSIHYKS